MSLRRMGREGARYEVTNADHAPCVWKGSCESLVPTSDEERLCLLTQIPARGSQASASFRAREVKQREGDTP